MILHHARPKNNDEGICQYAFCAAEVPDKVSIQLCHKHLRTAYAAAIIVGVGKLPSS
ncbi:hypothetical protein GCM10022377_10050 [Zhihengliuella alba]|uniref:Uncharacterized protein n=1 Tax=Zhihengliuella alba TaxID=547018 RepID=A0ABP7D0N3_9MICC